MSAAEISVRMLLCSRRHEPLSRLEWQRVAARCAWVKRTVDSLREATRQMNQRCDEAVERLSGEAFERLCDEEEAKVAAIRALLDAVIERDEWPRELHWGGV